MNNRGRGKQNAYNRAALEPKRAVNEHSIQRVIRDYALYQYGLRVLVNSDVMGIPIPVGLRKKLVEIRGLHKWPDMTVAYSKQGYNHMYMELKKTYSDVFRQDGSLKETEHTMIQACTLLEFRRNGSFADFVFGVNNAKNCLDWYMTGKGEYKINQFADADERLEAFYMRKPAQAAKSRFPFTAPFFSNNL